MEKGVIYMKKFLVSFIIGIVLMAIGTTSLIFEISKFEHVDAADKFLKEGYTDELITLKEDEDVTIQLEDGYKYSYEWNYDESMKDRVKITFVNGVSYRKDGNVFIVEDIDDYDDAFEDGWDRFRIFIDGLKERKIYSYQYEDIIITTSHANRGRIHMEPSYDY